MADYLVTDTELTSVADAIRTKGGTSAALSFPTDFVNAIDAIQTGGASRVRVNLGMVSDEYLPESAEKIIDETVGQIYIELPNDSMFVGSLPSSFTPQSSGTVTFSVIATANRMKFPAIFPGSSGGAIT